MLGRLSTASNFRRGKLVVGGVALAASSYLTFKSIKNEGSNVGTNEHPDKLQLPSRKQNLEKLKTVNFDVLIIGGGATGGGAALDAANRGLKTACVERDDFGSGTTGRSTKLIHGGVRYLEKAVKNLDYGQYKLVREALHERATLLKIAPHLCAPLPIMLPIYSWVQLPYFWAGSKAYDLVAGSQRLKSSYFLSSENAREQFPMLKPNGLVGAMIYYDGQHEDSRMNLTVLLTAVTKGATIANYVEVQEFTKDEKGHVNGAIAIDRITDEQVKIKAKTVINATGPFTDAVRKMDDNKLDNIVVPSSGVHIILPDYYSPTNMGLIDPATSDGRVIFFLPWQGKTLAGTTDRPTEISAMPYPTESEITFILNEIRNYLHPDVRVRRGDVLAAWTGIRPLVLNPNSTSTQELCRNHVIHVSESQLITIAGGKWTTYRSMAEETIDKAVEIGGLTTLAKYTATDELILVGGVGWTPNSFIQLIQEFGLDQDVANHLSKTYGTQAFNVAKESNLTGHRWPIVGKRLHPEFPYIEAEVSNAIDEYACKAVDVIARRTRIAFLNYQAAHDCLPRVVEIMANRLGWDEKTANKEYDDAVLFLRTMGYEASKTARQAALADLSEEEIKKYKNIFAEFDNDKDGKITAKDLQNVLSDLGQKVSEESLKDIIAEVDRNKDGNLDFNEFLMVMSSADSSLVSHQRLGAIFQKRSLDKKRITVERSGGGV